MTAKTVSSATCRIGMAVASGDHPLKFDVLAKCPVTRARTSLMHLPHATVETPVFMPVGTQGAIKGVTPSQMKAMDCRILLGNTYHLGLSPGTELLDKAGGLHKFMSWDRALLTDSGGFQMVSLLELTEITEEGVNFSSPYDGKRMLLTPEESIRIQNCIGADIMMQLDDVVSSTTTGPRVEEAMHRTLRWLDRCIAANKRPTEQNLFPIVQGGLDGDLRRRCAEEIVKRDCGGYAIGGLSGGEQKEDFWRMVHVSTGVLPDNKPRYLMGVGLPLDLVVCVALGCDMFDCVMPSRTGRFGSLMLDSGLLHIKKSPYQDDHGPIDSTCSCSTCADYSRAHLHHLFRNKEKVACCLATVHNLHYELNLMRRIRESIKAGTFPQFARDYVAGVFPNKDYPAWCMDALSSVNIHLQT
eukprot:scpid35213/ scgid11868/ Queuine tRNA-ribosyltransferase; Guanine insertion enzyme; tRNA-guanine transglycosylase